VFDIGRFLLKAIGMRLRFLVPGILVLVCAFARSSRYLVSRLDAELIAGVARAAGKSAGMQGLTKPGPLDWAALGLWHAGAAPLLGWMRWLGCFCAWTAGLAVVAALLAFVFSRLRGATARRVAMGAVAFLWLWLTVSGVWTAVKWRREALNDPAFTTPVSLLDSLRIGASGRVFCNFQALPYLLAYCPKLADDRLTPGRIGTLAQDPAAWRREDREKPFGGVLLVEPAEDTDPLLRHLLLSPDWHLAAMSNMGMVFLPGHASAFAPPSPDDAIPSLRNNRLKAAYLAGMAQQLHAAGFSGASHDYITKALDLDGGDPDVLIRAATLLAMDKRWNDALDLSREALDKRPDLIEGKMILARAYLAVGEPAAAYGLAADVAAAAPENVFALFLLARASEGNHDYASEAQALEKIISICEPQGQQVGQYRILLAQAYARQGFAQPALDQYNKALQSGEIGADQAKLVKDAMKTITLKMPRQTP
jgi:hypothetical protein